MIDWLAEKAFTSKEMRKTQYQFWTSVFKTIKTLYAGEKKSILQKRKHVFMMTNASYDKKRGRGLQI